MPTLVFEQAANGYTVTEEDDGIVHIAATQAACAVVVKGILRGSFGDTDPQPEQPEEPGLFDNAGPADD